MQIRRKPPVIVSGWSGWEPSGAVLYGTTPYFLERMGMTSLDELPPLAPYLPDLDALEDVDEAEGAR